MNFFEILFFIIYIRFLISWPLRTLAWTFTMFIGLLGIVLIIIGLALVYNGGNGWSLFFIVFGAAIDFYLVKTLISVFSTPKIQNQDIKSHIEDDPEKIFDVLADSMQGQSQPKNTDA